MVTVRDVRSNLNSGRSSCTEVLVTGATFRTIALACFFGVGDVVWRAARCHSESGVGGMSSFSFCTRWAMATAWSLNRS